MHSTDSGWSSLRKLLLIPSETHWADLVQLLESWPEGAEREKAVQYAQQHLSDWPTAIRTYPGQLCFDQIHTYPEHWPLFRLATSGVWKLSEHPGAAFEAMSASELEDATHLAVLHQTALFSTIEELTLSGHWGSIDVLSDLKKLRKLHIQDNSSLSHFPSEAHFVETLEELTLDSERPYTLPTPTHGLTRLHTLTLGRHSEIEWDTLHRLPALRHLHLTGHDTPEDLEDIIRCTELQSLKICRFGLEEEELEALSQLTKLHSLSLSQNRLHTIPECVVQLHALHTLDLSGNQIRVCPDQLLQMKQLKILNLADNLLRALPTWLTQCTHLEQIILTGNRLPKKAIRAASQGPQEIFKWIESTSS